MNTNIEKQANMGLRAVKTNEDINHPDAYRIFSCSELIIPDPADIPANLAWKEWCSKNIGILGGETGNEAYRKIFMAGWDARK